MFYNDYSPRCDSSFDDHQTRSIAVPLIFNTTCDDLTSCQRKYAVSIDHIFPAVFFEILWTYQR